MQPGEELIKNLEMLRRDLNALQKQLNESGTERTNHFLTFVGTDCTYYRKSLDLFLEHDYERLREQIRSLADLFDLLDGTEVREAYGIKV